MKKVLSKKEKVSKNERTRDQYTVVLENIQSDFKVFGEHLELVEQKLDAHIIQTHESFERMSQEFEFIKTELGIIRNDLKEKVSREEFRLLEMKVASLESELRSKK